MWIMGCTLLRCLIVWCNTLWSSAIVLPFSWTQNSMGGFVRSVQAMYKESFLETVFLTTSLRIVPSQISICLRVRKDAYFIKARGVLWKLFELHEKLTKTLKNYIGGIEKEYWNKHDLSNAKRRGSALVCKECLAKGCTNTDMSLRTCSDRRMQVGKAPDVIDFQQFLSFFWLREFPRRLSHVPLVLGTTILFPFRTQEARLMHTLLTLHYFRIDCFVKQVARNHRNQSPTWWPQKRDPPQDPLQLFQSAKNQTFHSNSVSQTFLKCVNVSCVAVKHMLVDRGSLYRFWCQLPEASRGIANNGACCTLSWERERERVRLKE